jgi:hypothetical protein
MEEIRNIHTILVEQPAESEQQDLKQEKVWSGFSWLTIGSSGRLL